MKLYRLSFHIVIMVSLIVFSFIMGKDAYPLTSGETYTISIEKLNSDGTVTSGSTSLGLSTTATADSNGKITFSLSGIPNNSTCNFLVITIKDSSGSTARKSIVPCPDPGSTLPAGVSDLTEKQTDALLSAVADAGTDDPILAVFGFAIVRSGSISSSDLSTMASLAYQGIVGTNGFVDYLTSNGVTSSQLALYRNSIVSQMADPDSGYSKLIKDSVDATTTTDELSKRGKAASVLMDMLMDAASTAGFSPDRVLEAFDAMGAIVVPAMQQAVSNGSLSAAGSKMIDSSIGGAIDKLRAKRLIKKYTAALTTLGATGADVTQYTTAASTLSDTMTAAFQTFDQVFDGNETSTDIQTAESTFDTTMQNAFNQFMQDTAASDARINTMISNIDNALGQSTGLTVSDFQFHDSSGNAVNWSITMVIPTDWISSIVAAGGELTYTRDTTSIPNSITWLGTCSDQNYTDKNNCEGNGGTWTTSRTDFVGDGTPTSYASLLGLQEDVMILEFTRFEAQQSAGNDMSAHQQLEKNFADSVSALANNLGGTTDGSTPISSTIKSALVTLMQSPQF